MPNNSCDSENENGPFGVYIQNLDMDGITGISCQTVHPIVSETVDWAMDNDTFSLSAPNLFRQVAACMAVEFTKRMGETAIANPEDVDLMPVVVPDGDNEEIIAFYVSARKLVDIFEDVANLALLAWQTASKRLDLDAGEATMPSAFPLLVAMLVKMLTAIESKDLAEYSDAMEKMTGLIISNKALLLRMLNTDPINPPMESVDDEPTDLR